MNIKNKIPTIINFILDRSGSMDSIRKDVIGGFNSYIKGLQKSKDADKTLFTLTTFDSMSIETPYLAVPIKEIKKMTEKDFEPRASTPLYDAVVNTVEKLSEKVEKNQPILVVIMTDGEENASTEHNQDCLKDLVEKLKIKGNWTFVFMGANQDSWGNASQYGLSMGNTTNWESSSVGTKNAFRSLANSSVMFMSAVNDDSKNLKSVDNFFESK